MNGLLRSWIDEILLGLTKNWIDQKNAAYIEAGTMKLFLPLNFILTKDYVTHIHEK